jgi:hypothetical protein
MARNIPTTTTLMAKTWLARAGTCSLSISFTSYLDSQISLQPLIQVFVLHCDRWRDIKFWLPQSEIRHLSPARNCMPRLQRLVFGLRSGLVSGTEAIDAFEYAPQLHSLELTGVVLSSFKVPYYQLKHSDFREREADGILQFLSFASNLETCIMAPMNSDSHRPPVLLPNLRSIDMTIRGDLSNFFDRLLLPKLRELHVTLWNVPWTAVPQFISLVSRGSLEKLTFYSNPTNRHPYDGDMIKVLRAVPSIVQLELIGSTPQCMTKLFLAQFTRHQQSNDMDPPTILPMLRSITVDYTPSFFDILAFADAIQSRMVDGTGQPALEGVSGACLRTVQIRCFPPFEAKTLESLDSIGLSRLQQLQNLGVDLSIIYGHNGCGEFTKL